MKGVIVLLSLLALVAAVPTQLSYTLGQNYVYNVTGVVQNNGYDTIEDSFVPGYISTMSAVMVMQPLSENATTYYFVMNLFDTTVSVNNNSSPSPSTTSGNSLGEDVYFYQDKTGQVTQIEYYSDDPVYYVNVKVSAINAFQTAFVAVGQNSTILESDPIGNHQTAVSASLSANGVLLLTEVFNQADFVVFPDPTLTPTNMDINARQVTGVHPTGYVVSSTYNQAAILRDISDATYSASKSSKRGITNSTGFETFLSAIGSLNVDYMSDSSSNSLYQVQKFKSQADGYIVDTFFGFATKSVEFARDNSLDGIEDAVETISKEKTLTLAYLTKVGNYLRRHPQEAKQLAPLNTLAASSDLILDRLFFVLTVAQNEELIVKFGFQSPSCVVRHRAVLAAPHLKSKSAQLIAGLRIIAADQSCPNAQAIAKSILHPKVAAASPFPFNKTYGGSFKVGGAIAGVDFAANLFVGTNLNCNNAQFNYEGSAEVSAEATLFGYGQPAFDAQIVYGQENGSPLADALTVSIWGNQVYNQPIPVIDCQSGNYPLYHTAPGFSIEHTLWVSIIPVVFSASANLDLTLDWGWNVCASQLSASIDLNGDGAIELSGSSYTDLILLRAGFEISGSLNADLTPTAYVQGTACEVGFEVDETNQPMTAAVTSYYQWKKCKFLFFDCKWGDYNQQNWWSWSLPAQETVLYKQTYTIA
jgi:hypothetical protein